MVGRQGLLPKENRNAKRSTGVILFVFLVSLFTVAAYVQVDPYDWSEPVSLSAPTGVSGWTPRLTADVSGTIHAIWGGWIGPDPAGEQATDTIFYSRLEDGIWSHPVDILISSTSNPILYIGDIRVSPNGLIVISWVSNGELMVSSVEAGSAMDASSWLTSNIDSQSTRPLIAINEQNDHWFLTYVKDNVSVLITMSTDQGRLWAPPEIIWSVSTGDVSPFIGSIAISSGGTVHLAWDEHDAERNWNPVAIMHSDVRSFSRGPDNVREIARSHDDGPTIGWPAIATDAEDSVHIIWNNGVGSRIGRQYQWSIDDGNNWSPVAPILADELSGQTGLPAVAIDSNGTIHLITSAMGPDNITAIRYTNLKNGSWSNYVSLWPLLHPGEHPDAAITNGNLLHVVWNDYRNSEVMYTSRQLDSKWLPSSELVTIEEDQTQNVQIAADPEQDSSQRIETVSEEPRVEFDTEPDDSSTDANKALIIGIVPVILLIVLVSIRTIKQR